MKAWPLLVAFVLLVLVIVPSARAQSNKERKQASVYPKVTMADTEVRRIHSAIVGDDHEISIALPKDYKTSTARYGVIYAPDEWLFFRTIYDTYRVLGLAGELPPLIIVGIGFPNTSTNYDTIRSKVRDLRTRDMSPYQVDSLDTPSMKARGVKTGGADKFLAFLKQELMPFMEKNYRASPNDKTYIGYSYGGLFGIYTLFHSPETFSRYLIGSPGSIYGSDKNILLRYEKEYAAKHKDLPAKVFLSTGSLEPEIELSGFQPAVKAIRSRNYKGLNLKTWVFEGETHLSAPAGTINRGLHELYIAK